MKHLSVLLIILSYLPSGYMQTVTTLEASSFLVRTTPEKPELRRDLLIRDSIEIARIIQNISATESEIQIESDKLIQLNGMIESPSKEFCLLYHEGEMDTRTFYIAEKKEGRYLLIKKIDISLYPRVRFSRDGNAIVVFNDFADNFFIYVHKNRVVRQYDSFRKFGIPPGAPISDMLISNDGKHLAISANGFQIVNLEVNMVLYELKHLVNSKLISFSSDNNFIFMWAGTKIQGLDADLIIANIRLQKVEEVLNLPMREYKEGIGYINNAEYFKNAYGGFIMHDLNLQTYTQFKMR